MLGLVILGCQVWTRNAMLGHGRSGYARLGQFRSVQARFFRLG